MTDLAPLPPTVKEPVTVVTPGNATPIVAVVGIAITAATGLASLAGPVACLIALTAGLAVLGVTVWWASREMR